MAIEQFKTSPLAITIVRCLIAIKYNIGFNSIYNSINPSISLSPLVFSVALINTFINSNGLSEFIVNSNFSILNKAPP